MRLTIVTWYPFTTYVTDGVFHSVCMHMCMCVAI